MVTRALIVGLAREGTALARFLVGRGVQVIVTDIRTAGQLAHAKAALESLPVQYSLGGHPLSLLDGVDIVFASPGVPKGIPLLAEAERRGLVLSSESRLFTHLCPAPVVGITGSSGKTTTTTLVGDMLRAAGKQVWVGGNIGRPLLGHLDEIDSDHVVVMELSSFQLGYFGPHVRQGKGALTRKPGVEELFEPAGWSPHIAALLNITPNHLDRHLTMQAYVDAKSNILNHQRPGDTAVVGLDSPLARQVANAAHLEQRMVWFSLEQEVEDGGFLRREDIIVRLKGDEERICRTADLKLLGRHNVANVLSACTIAALAGAPPEAIRQVATGFSGVEHRLEKVLDRHGVRWYNDSIATSPERTAAALQAFDAPIILLVGGRDKHLPWNEVASLSRDRARHVILFGEAAGIVEKAMREAGISSNTACQLHRADDLERAVLLADHLASNGDVVLLSPGCTSFDSYQDFVARGEHFRELVKALG